MIPKVRDAQYVMRGTTYFAGKSMEAVLSLHAQRVQRMIIK